MGLKVFVLFSQSFKTTTELSTTVHLCRGWTGAHLVFVAAAESEIQSVQSGEERNQRGLWLFSGKGGHSQPTASTFSWNEVQTGYDYPSDQMCILARANEQFRSQLLG